MISYIWPIILLVASNTVYQICAKSVPDGIHPLAALSVTYLVGAAASTILYFAIVRNGNLLQEYRNLNWAPFALGLAIVGLELGFIYAFKAGWPVSTAQIVQAAFLAVVLIIVGYFVYHESLSTNRIVGIVICLVGLYFINK